MNTESSQVFSEDNVSSKNEKGFFDSIEIKGLSAKSARFFSTGKFAKFLRFVSKLLAFTPARVYGLFFLSFGVLTLFLNLGEYYFMENPRVSLSSLAVGAFFAVISVFLIISDKPICIALQSVRVIDFIVFDIFSINRMQKSDGEEKKISGAVGIILGLLLSVLCLFVPAEYLGLGLLGLIFAAVAMTSPEFPYIFSLLIFPYLSLIPHSSWIFIFLIVLTVISFVRKVLVGKRNYSLEIYDFLFLFLILAVLLTGVILGGSASTENSLLIIFFALAYIPASNMAVNRRLFDCISGAVSAASIPISLYAVIRYVTELIFFERTAAKAFFDSSEILAVYLFTIAIFSLYPALKRTNIVKKSYYFAVFALSSLALLTTECLLIFVVFVFTFAAYSIISSKKTPCYLLFLVLLLPALLWLIGDTALLSLSETFSITPSLYERKERAGASLSFFFNNFFLGGADSVFTEGDFSYNVYVGLGAGFGVLAILVFVLLIVLRVLHLSLYKKYFSDSTVDFYVDISALALVSLLVFGTYIDVFSDIEMLYLFVSVFATGSAALRVSKKEKEEKLSYYRDLGSSDHAAIDVSIKD